MYIIILAPVFSFVIDFFRNCFNFSKFAIILLFAVIIIPILLIWTTGYDFSIQNYKWLALTLMLTFIGFVFFTILNIKSRYKFFISVVMALPILIVTYVGSLGAEFGGGKREVLNETTFNNYIAVELGPKMYEDYNTLIIYKTKFSNFISKSIFEMPITDSSKKYNCETHFKDKNVQLKYDCCNHELLIR